MKIRMLKTMPGSVDGTAVRDYEAGQDYDLTATAGARDLAAVFVREGWAEPVVTVAGGTVDADAVAATLNAKRPRPRK